MKKYYLAKVHLQAVTRDYIQASLKNEIDGYLSSSSGERKRKPRPYRTSRLVLLLQPRSTPYSTPPPSTPGSDDGPPTKSPRLHNIEPSPTVTPEPIIRAQLSGVRAALESLLDPNYHCPASKRSSSSKPSIKSKLRNYHVAPETPVCYKIGPFLPPRKRTFSEASLYDDVDADPKGEIPRPMSRVANAMTRDLPTYNSSCRVQSPEQGDFDIYRDGDFDVDQHPLTIDSGTWHRGSEEDAMTALQPFGPWLAPSP